jgi:hypothetical protein
MAEMTDIFSLIILKDATKCSFRSTQSSVQCMDVSLPGVEQLLLPIPDLKLSRLVVCAVRDGNQLLVLPLKWKPCLKVILFRSSVIERTRDDGDNSVRKFQRLIELLRHRGHVFKRLPGVLGLGEEELFNLNFLLDTYSNIERDRKGPSQIDVLGKSPKHLCRVNQLLSDNTCYSRRICNESVLLRRSQGSRLLDRKIFFIHPFAVMQCGNRLF